MSKKVKIRVNDKRTLGKDPVPEEENQVEAPAEELADQEPPQEESGEERTEAEEEDPERIIADQKDQILRLHAEFENYRKRTEREMASFKRYANEGLIKAILSHLDNLERALEHCRVDNPEDPMLTGVELTLKGLTDSLEKFGVSRIEALGKPFDPSLHEAVIKGRLMSVSMDPESSILAFSAASLSLCRAILSERMSIPWSLWNSSAR